MEWVMYGDIAPLIAAYAADRSQARPSPPVSRAALLYEVTADECA